MSFGELWRQILDQSNLAYAISRIYTGISQSKIAHVLLNRSLGLSLQIPIVSEIAVLPSLMDPPMPGLFVSFLFPFALRLIGRASSSWLAWTQLRC